MTAPATRMNESMKESMKEWTAADIPAQTGKLAVVTGATGGLGYEIALALAKAGADVIVAARNAARGDRAIRSIRAICPDARVHFELLDLASLESIEQFAARTVTRGRQLDLLVNNAGVMALPDRHLSADGYELQFATNHLGHFALTARLLPLLKGVHRARVVTLSSLAHRQGRIDVDDLQASRSYQPWKAYAQSKLANLLFSLELQRRSEANGWGLVSIGAHPGSSRTELIANGPGTTGGVLWRLSLLLSPWLSQFAAEGALPALYAATSAAAQGGAYYGPDGFYEMKGRVAHAKVAQQARDERLAAALWALSNELAQVAWE